MALTDDQRLKRAQEQCDSLLRMLNAMDEACKRLLRSRTFSAEQLADLMDAREVIRDNYRFWYDAAHPEDPTVQQINRFIEKMIADTFSRITDKE